MPPTYSPLVAPTQTAGSDDSSSFGLREQNLRFILGLKLHNLRQERRLSLVQLSKGCGLSVSYLNEIEKGKKYPKTDKLLSLARALGVTYDELVSADPGEKLRPIAALLTTRMIEDLPLDHYGISPPVLMEIMAAGPDRLGALLTFLHKLATRYGFGVDDLLEAAVRDDLEAADYRFGDLEDKALSLASEIGWQSGQVPILSQVRFSLQHDFGWEIDEEKLGEFPDLSEVAAVPVFGGSKPRLFLQPNLPNGRRAFVLVRELAATALGQYARSRKQVAPVEHGFRRLQARTKAAYLGGALLVPRAMLVAELQGLLAASTWDDGRLLALVEKFGGDAETVFHRIAQVLPELGLPARSLSRTVSGAGGSNLVVDREMRLGGLPEIEGAALPGKRAIPGMVQKLAATVAGLPKAGAAIGRETSASGEILRLAVAQQHPLRAGSVSVVTLGLPLDDAARGVLGFLQDPALPRAEPSDSRAADKAATARSSTRPASLAAFLEAVGR